MSLPTLPPPDVAAVYVYAGNEQHGPMDRRALYEQLAAGRFSDDDMFWYAEMEGWVRLGDHPELLDDVRPAPVADPSPAPSAPSFEPSFDLEPEEPDPALLRTTALSTADLERAAASYGQDGPRAAEGGVDSIAFGSSESEEPAAGMATIAMSAASVAEAVAQSQLEEAQRDGAQRDGAQRDEVQRDEAQREQDAGSYQAPDTAEPSFVDASTAQAFAAEPSAGFSEHAAGSREDEALDAIFVDLVESSWAWVHENRFAGHIDEVFLGALVTGTLDAGFSLIDLTSDGTHHYLRFESLGHAPAGGGSAPPEGSRLVVRLRHLTSDLARARVLGQRASVVIGYGERAPNAGKIMEALKAELKSGFLRDAEPGTITVDGDMTSGYIYAQIDLHWSLDEYVAADYTIESTKITRHVSACAHALRKYLRGRFAA